MYIYKRRGKKLPKKPEEKKSKGDPSGEIKLVDLLVVLCKISERRECEGRVDGELG